MAARCERYESRLEERARRTRVARRAALIVGPLVTGAAGALLVRELGIQVIAEGALAGLSFGAALIVAAGLCRAAWVGFRRFL